MPSAATIRLEIEASLAGKIPSALTPRPKLIRPIAATGIDALDEALRGGLPVGALSEFVGPECSGRTTTALSFVARITQAGKVCAWIDVSDALDPVSAAAAGVDLSRLLWVRCGVVQERARPNKSHFCLPEECFIPGPAKKGLHGGGFGPHPRTESHGLAQAVSGLLRSKSSDPGREQPAVQSSSANQHQAFNIGPQPSRPVTQWSRMEQAMRATDLLLQAGGFSAVVLDLGSLTPEFVTRIPLATWHRYRAAAERTHSSIVLLTQYACAKSSAELQLRFQPGRALRDETTVFTGMMHSIEVLRQRFTQTGNVVSLRKPPQGANAASWPGRTAWAGSR